MKRLAIIVGCMVIGLAAPAAMAGSLPVPAQSTVDVGPVTMPQAEFQRLQQMVGGEAGAPVNGAGVAMETLGLAEMTAADADLLRRFVAGTAVPSPAHSAAVASAATPLGLIDMPGWEYAALKNVMSVHGIRWGAVVAAGDNGETPNAGR